MSLVSLLSLGAIVNLPRMGGLVIRYPSIVSGGWQGRGGDGLTASVQHLGRLPPWKTSQEKIGGLVREGFTWACWPAGWVSWVVFSLMEEGREGGLDGGMELTLLVSLMVGCQLC